MKARSGARTLKGYVQVMGGGTSERYSERNEAAMLWDVFISHASEDKASVARPLAQKLQSAGLRVWIDEAQLKLGDSLTAKINEGLAQSRFGVVILSSAFLAKQWTHRELGAIFARSNTLLPV